MTFLDFIPDELGLPSGNLIIEMDITFDEYCRRLGDSEGFHFSSSAYWLVFGSGFFEATRPNDVPLDHIMATFFNDDDIVPVFKMSSLITTYLEGENINA